MSQEVANFNRIKKFLTEEQIAKYYSSNIQENNNDFENSNIYATYAIDDEIDNIAKLKNISDIKEYLKIKDITKYHYGDLFSFSSNRDVGTLILGKNGVLIPNPDYSGTGYLTIPYEITQYLDDATNKYNDIDVNCIDLRYDDKFIKNNIGEIPKSWNFKFTKTDEDIISIEFPNGRVNDFKINTKPEDIYNFYLGSQKEQATIKLSYIIKGEKYHEFKNKYGYNTVPSNLLKTWSVEYGSSGGGTDNKNGTLKFNGPFEEVANVLDILNKYYDGFDVKVQVMQ